MESKNGVILPLVRFSSDTCVCKTVRVNFIPRELQVTSTLTWSFERVRVVCSQFFFFLSPPRLIYVVIATPVKCRIFFFLFLSYQTKRIACEKRIARAYISRVTKRVAAQFSRYFARIIRIVDNNGNAVVGITRKKNNGHPFAKLGKRCAIHVAYASYFVCAVLSRGENQRIILLVSLFQSEQYSAGFAGPTEGVSDDSGNLQMWSPVPVQARGYLQL